MSGTREKGRSESCFRKGLSMESLKKERSLLNLLGWMVFLLFVLPVVRHYGFQPTEWKSPAPGTMNADPNADPFPIFGSEESKEAWRDRHPIKSWTRPETWR